MYVFYKRALPVNYIIRLRYELFEISMLSRECTSIVYITPPWPSGTPWPQ